MIETKTYTPDELEAMVLELKTGIKNFREFGATNFRPILKSSGEWWLVDLTFVQDGAKRGITPITFANEAQARHVFEAVKNA